MRVIQAQTLTAVEIEHEADAKTKRDILGKLMITIVGALPAIAFSDYADYAVRERVSEGLNLAGAAKTLVNDNVKKAVPDFSKGWTGQELNGLTHFVGTIKISPSTGVITIIYTEQAKNISMTLTPYADGTNLVAGTIPFEAIRWRCAVGDAGNNKYVPTNCRV
jgi:type IV pilus assembly protein PilA